MNKAFTLLELIVVVIIVGILSTIALTQYGKTIERTRGAEARAILGSVRLQAAIYRMEYATLSGFTNSNGGVGTAWDQAPDSSGCRLSHYFSYATNANEPVVTITATRCTTGGKTPNGILLGANLILTSNLMTGEDNWGGIGIY